MTETRWPPMQARTVAPGDRVQFNDKRTSWLVRAETPDGRYTLLTASLFGKIVYTIIDWVNDVRGPMNVLGGGLGIFTTSGPDKRIDKAILMLRPYPPFEPGETSRPVDMDDPRGFEVSRRYGVPLRITGIRKPSTDTASG